MTVNGWVLAVDFGTSFTAVAASGPGGVDEVVEIDNEKWMPSGVFWQTGPSGQHGRLLLGDEAVNAAETAPERMERCPKAHLGEPFITLGGEQVRVTDAIGEIFRYVAVEAKRRHGGRDPGEVRLTHPARWRGHRLNDLRAAAGVAGFREPVFVAEPVGAALFFATERAQAGEMRVGDHVAVYDLGGGTFDTAVLERTHDGFTVVGEPGGIELIGGEKFDDRLYEHLGEQMDVGQWQALRAAGPEPEWRRAAHDFRTSVRKAKERLSREDATETSARVPAPFAQELKVSRSMFESLIRADIEQTVAELERTVNEAGSSVDRLRAIYLAGGSSRIPLVERTIVERLGRKPDTLGDPKSVIARGAVRGTLPKPASGPVGAGPRTTARNDERAAVTKQPTTGLISDAAVAVVGVGAAVGIGSLFLPEFGSDFTSVSSWTVFEKSRSIVIIALMLLTFALAAAARRSSRLTPLLGATAAALWTCGLVTFLDVPYKSVRSGFWLGAAASIGVAVVLSAASGKSWITQVRPRLRPVGETTPLLLTCGLAALAGTAAVAASNFLHVYGRGTALTYGNAYVIARLAMCCLVAMLVVVTLTSRRVAAAWVATGVALVLSGASAFLGALRNAEVGVKVGLVGGVLAALAASLLAWNLTRMSGGAGR